MIARKRLEYRKNEDGSIKGNCFSDAIITGLTLLDDTFGANPKPELAIFSEEELKGDEEKEFAPALTYLVKNGYDVQIVDPDLENKNLWGSSLKEIRPSNIKKESYTKEDIIKYVKEEYAVIFSTRATISQKRRPHAILAYKESLYDSESPSFPKFPISDIDAFIDRVINEKKFFIAFKKKNKTRLKIYLNIIQSFLTNKFF